MARKERTFEEVYEEAMNEIAEDVASRNMNLNKYKDEYPEVINDLASRAAHFEHVQDSKDYIYLNNGRKKKNLGAQYE